MIIKPFSCLRALYCKFCESNASGNGHKRTRRLDLAGHEIAFGGFSVRNIKKKTYAYPCSAYFFRRSAARYFSDTKNRHSSLSP